jgi:hypothetical protein
MVGMMVASLNREADPDEEFRRGIVADRQEDEKYFRSIIQEHYIQEYYIQEY